MTIWLCPVKPGNWRIIEKQKVFALPSRAVNTVKHLRQGDKLVFYLLKPINGIIAVGEVVSDVYEDYLNFWEKGQYPLRVKVRFEEALHRNRENAIPLGDFLGLVSTDEFEILPFLKDVRMVKVTVKQYKRLLKLLEG